MTTKRQKWFNAVNAVLDWCIIAAAYLLSIYVRQVVLQGGYVLPPLWSPPFYYAPSAIAYASAMLLLFVGLQLYGSYRFRSIWRELFTLATANGVGILLYSTLLYLLKLGEYARSQIALLYLFSVLGLFFKRLILRALLRYMRTRGHNTRSVLVVGSGPLAQRYYAELQARPWLGYNYRGFLAPADTGEMGRWRGGVEALRGILQKEKIEEVVVALPGQDTDLIGSLVSLCGRYGIKISIIPAYNDFIPSYPKVENLGSLKLLNVRRAPGRGVVWAAIKRTSDVVCALLALVLFSPVLLAAAVAVRLSSPGPVIFKQERVGLRGRHFNMYKFRSMYSDAEQRKAELASFNEADGPAFKMANDPRITRVGRFLRRTSIDELPQLVNILRGDMSVVGPRPPLPAEVEQYDDWEWGRLAVRPGLTCYWQISGRSNLPFAEWMRLDLKYIEEQGPWTDLKIICKTVGVVLRGDGAY